MFLRTIWQNNPIATKLILILSTWGIAIAPPAIAQSTQPATPERQIQVYFPKMPESRNNLDYVEPVTRTTDRVDVADFALEQLAQGPDSSEQAQGFVDPLDFQGTSAAFCRDRNFRIGIVDNLAYVQFCRTVESAGIGDDARIQSAVRETLKQFSTVDSVLLLTQNGDCWPGLSGQNACFDDLNVDGVIWQPIEGTRSNPSGIINNTTGPWEVGLNTITRNGNAINFDVNANSKYVRYSGNCQRDVLARIRIGDIENGNITDSVEVNERYTPTNRFQQEVLDYACNHSA